MTDTAPPIAERSIGFEVPDGVMEALYTRRDDGRTLPGVVLVHDVYGVTPHMRELGRAYAEAGYAVMTPTMYWRGDGPATGWPPRTAEIAKIGGYPDLRTIEDLKAAVAAMTRRPDVDGGRVAIAGYSFGARYGLFACTRGAEAAALVAFYPVIMYPALHENRPVQPLQYVDGLKIPALFAYGESDSLVPFSQVSLLRDLLHGQGKTHEFHTYPRVDHGFVNTMIKTPTTRRRRRTPGARRSASWRDTSAIQTLSLEKPLCKAGPGREKRPSGARAPSGARPLSVSPRGREV